MYHGIHTENEQFYLEAQKALHICPSLQHCHAESFPTSKHGNPVVSATSSQEVCNEASNLGAVPYVDSNA